MKKIILAFFISTATAHFAFAQATTKPAMPTSCNDFAVTITKSIAEAEEANPIMMLPAYPIDENGQKSTVDNFMYRVFYSYRSSGCIVYLDVTTGLSYRRKQCMLKKAVASASASCPNSNPL